MQTQRVAVFKSFNHTAARSPALHSASLKACFINVVQSEVRWGSEGKGWGSRAGGERVHCALDLKWEGAETMAMKKTWLGCEAQHHFHYFRRHGAQNGSSGGECKA